MTPEEIKSVRQGLGYTQKELAAALGVSFATVNRWENGKAVPQKDRIERIRELAHEPVKQEMLPFEELRPTLRLDFEGDAEAVKLVVDAYRLRNGHLFNKAFGLELSRVVPLPHQRIAVYEHLLPQNPLRFLLADDAGAGKTIMTGLYLREMINRGRIRRALICCPAGLTWNWQRELRHFFDLEFDILRGSDFQKGDPLSDTSRGLFIVSVDTAATDAVRERLVSASTPAFDLAVFDEAHKLSWGDPKRPDSRTRRHRLAEALAERVTHLLLLTATPHMGKPFPYFALWRLLDAKTLPTPEALNALSADKRARYFIRRLKEEMVDYGGQPIYMPRLCQTVSFALTEAERQFYEESSTYLRWSYDQNSTINKNAAAMVLAVLQRRLASSTFAMLESLRRRRGRLLTPDAITGGTDGIGLARIEEHFDSSTADEGEATAGRESDEVFDDAALALVQPQEAKVRQKELEYLDRVIALGEKVMADQCEAKFAKLRELVESAEFQNERLLVFTEHRDTLDYLRQRFEALGYTGQIASIHGGMDVSEREQQRILFMPPEVRRRQGIRDTGQSGARLMLATDAAGEGINLQFAWVMVNFDIPWNPARLEQRMGRLHRFGQQHSEVRIFNLVASDTREGDVLATLLAKLDEARKELCSDKVFDVVGQRLQELSIRDLLREALLGVSVESVRRKLDSVLATRRLRAEVEEQRKTASSYGDVARRLGQLNAELEVERFNKLLPAFIENFVAKCAPRVGIRIEGELTDAARFSVSPPEGNWFLDLAGHFPHGLPEQFSVRRDFPVQGVDLTRFAFLRPGDVVFDSLCNEVVRRFGDDTRRGSAFCDPAAAEPYYVSIYLCQIGEAPRVSHGDGGRATNLQETRLLALRWDTSGDFTVCPPNHLLALTPAPRSLIWKAGALLADPESQAAKSDAYARMFVETTYLQQCRALLRSESRSRVEDLIRGFDFQSGELAERRGELTRRVRDGEEAAQQDLAEIRKAQARLEKERAEALLFEEARAHLLDITRLERIGLALVVPDPSQEARECYDKNIEMLAMRIARNFEVDHHSARVFDVSSPHLARGYDLESHRANGERVAIEVKGRAGRGVIHLTENEWPTAVNVRDKYWLYVVVDCATNPVLYRVQDPAFKLAMKSRQSFTANIGDIIREAERD